MSSFVFFFNDTATTEIYTLSLHDALPISLRHAGASVEHLEELGDAWRLEDEARDEGHGAFQLADQQRGEPHEADDLADRSEEHTSELQSRQYLVCRLLLEKKKTTE